MVTDSATALSQNPAYRPTHRHSLRQYKEMTREQVVPYPAISD